MITIRPSAARGVAEHDWLSSHFTFSFADYYDPAHMGFRALRVINDDIIAGGGGFGMHPHRNMEIITYVTSGALSHKDSTGGGGTIKPGQVQYMSAGSGIRHSEFNANETEAAKLLQIWIMPNVQNAEPRYTDRDISKELATGEPVLIVSPDGENGSVAIRADVKLYGAKARSGWSTSYPIGNGRALWLQLISGRVLVNGEEISAGDGAAVEQEDTAEISAETDAEFLLFDLD